MQTRQIELEEQSHKEAVAKRRRELQQAKEKGYISGTTEGRQLFINLFLPYSEALRQRLNETMSGKASKWGSFAVHTHELSEELGIEYLAYCAMKKMIDCIDTGKNKLVDVATLIGRTIEAEVRINYYIQAGGEDTERLVSAKKKKKNSSPRHQHIGIKLSVEKQLLEKGWAQDELFLTWTPEVRTGIGLFLVEAAVQAEWFVRQPKRMTKNKTENVLLPSPAVEQWLQQAADGDPEYLRHWLRSLGHQRISPDARSSPRPQEGGRRRQRRRCQLWVPHERQSRVRSGKSQGLAEQVPPQPLWN